MGSIDSLLFVLTVLEVSRFQGCRSTPPQLVEDHLVQGAGMIREYCLFQIVFLAGFRVN